MSLLFYSPERTVRQQSPLQQRSIIKESSGSKSVQKFRQPEFSSTHVSRTIHGPPLQYSFQQNSFRFDQSFRPNNITIIPKMDSIRRVSPMQSKVTIINPPVIVDQSSVVSLSEINQPLQLKFQEIEKRLKTLEESRKQTKQTTFNLMSNEETIFESRTQNNNTQDDIQLVIQQRDELAAKVQELLNTNNQLKNLLNSKGDNSHEQLGEQQNYIRQLEQKNQILEQTIRDIHDQVREKLQENDSTIEQLKEKLAQSQEENSSLHDGNLRLEQEITHLTQQIKVIENEKVEIEGQKNEFARQLSIIEKRIISIEETKAEYEVSITEFQSRVRLYEAELESLRNQLNEAHNQNDDILTEYETKEETLTSEINTWKNRFIEVNKELHSVQEQFMLTQAELENVKKNMANQKKIVTTTTTSQRQSDSRRQSVAQSNVFQQ